jgi:hypothetical protein
MKKYQDGGRKIRFVPGTYDPKETAGYELQAPEVKVPIQGAPWVKFMREYEKNNPMDKFVSQKKKAFLKRNAGLNKSLGVTMDNFPTDVLQNFVSEYERKKNSYVTKMYGKEAGFNPNRRGDWVEEINPTFKDKFVANSKYESKLEPSYLSRGLAGAQELGNFLIKTLPGTQGDVLKYKVPGLTSKEQKEIANSNMGALETFAPIDIPGVAMANYLKNVGLTTGSDYKELPAWYSGEKMSNVTDIDAMASNPLNWTLPADIAGLASLAPAAGRFIKGAPAAFDNLLASGIGRVNEELVGRAGKYFDPGAVTDLPVDASPERLKFLQDVEELKRTTAFNNSTESKKAALSQVATRTSVPDEIFEKLTGYNKQELLGVPKEEPMYFGFPLTQEQEIALQEARAAGEESLRRQGVEPNKAAPEGYSINSVTGEMIPAPTGSAPEDAFARVREAQQRAAQEAGNGPTQNTAADLDIDNELPPPPDELIIPGTESFYNNARSSSDAYINMMNASQDTRNVRSFADRLAEIRGSSNIEPDNLATYHRRDLSMDPDFALTPDEIAGSGPDLDLSGQDYIDYENLDAYGTDPYGPDAYNTFVNPPEDTRTTLQKFTEAIRNSPAKVKKSLIDSSTMQEAKRLPELYKSMFQAPTAKYYEYAAPSLNARSFESPRKMQEYLVNSINNKISSANVGDVITGSTNTSYNSYVPQMGYIFKNAGKNGLSEPVFLGYEPMNSLGYLSKADIVDINESDILAHLNKQLNNAQKRMGKNMYFEKNPVYKDESGIIMLPQYGLRKLKEGTKEISKKLKYGGDTGKLQKFTK